MQLEIRVHDTKLVALAQFDSTTHTQQLMYSFLSPQKYSKKAMQNFAKINHEKCEKQFFANMMAVSET